VADEPFHLRVDRDRFVPLASVAIAVAIVMASLLGVSRIKVHKPLSENLYDEERRIDRAEVFFTWFTLLGQCADGSKETRIVEVDCA
jgi:hypothetical protein